MAIEQETTKEVEQKLSTFRFSSKKTPLSVYNPPETSVRVFPHFKGGWSDYLFKKILAFYREVGFSLGSGGAFVVPDNTDLFFNQFEGVVNFLKKEGIIKNVRFREYRYNDTPVFFRAAITHSYSTQSTDGRLLQHDYGYGFGKDPKTVLSKAIGELLERYFFTVYDKRSLLWASPADLSKQGVNFIDVSLLAGFSDEQKRRYPLRVYDENSVYFWEKVVRYSTQETFFVPAQLVYWNYIRAEGEPVLCEQNTNGCGGMFTEEGAILSGLYELIQRDAFLIHWLKMLTPPKVTPKTVPDKQFQLILKESERYGFKIHCLNITLDTGVPSFVVVVEDKNGMFPKFSLGGGCQADPAKALRRALEEAWSVYYWKRSRTPYTLPEPYDAFYDDSINQDQRLRLWSNPSMFEKYQFLIIGKEKDFSAYEFNYPKDFPSPREELELLVRRIEDLGSGYEVYYRISNHSILSMVGYSSAKAIVPKFIPLYLNETMIPLGSKRLNEVLEKTGYGQRGNFNLWPHPFP